MDDLTTISIDPTKFRDARERKGLTQEAAASAIGVSDGLISKIERDKGLPSADVLLRLCKLYEIEIDEVTRVAA